MDPRDLEKRLRLLPGGSSLFVKRDAEFARKNAKHPDAWQVWDVGHASGVPYFILSVQRRGLPWDAPIDLVVKEVARLAVTHGGRKGWLDELELGFAEEERATEREREARLDAGREERRDMAYHRFGKLRHFNLNRAVLPCASANSSPSSATV